MEESRTFKVSKLLNDSEVVGCIHNLGIAKTEELYDGHGRCSGKSTAKALSIISEAMHSPGSTVIFPRDQWAMVEYLINRLELQYFKLERDNLVYDIFAIRTFTRSHSPWEQVK